LVIRKLREWVGRVLLAELEEEQMEFLMNSVRTR
jgi:hypothetical protein